jgi:hypothetical protein
LSPGPVDSRARGSTLRRLASSVRRETWWRTKARPTTLDAPLRRTVRCGGRRR